MALNGFIVLRYVPTAPEVLAEIKRIIYILRFAPLGLVTVAKIVLFRDTHRGTS